MRLHRAPLCATALTVLALSVTGCGSDSGSAQPNLPPDAQSALSKLLQPQTDVPDPNAPCVIGHWAVVHYGLYGDVATADGSGNFHLVVAPDGQSDLDFTGMWPVTITVTLPDPTATSGIKTIMTDSELTYSGKVGAKLKLPSAGLSTGPWEPEPGVDWSTVHLTLDTAGKKVFDDVPVSGLTGDGGVPGAGNTQPLLGTGKFTCEDTTLTVVQQVGGNQVTWEMRRERP